MKVLDIISVIIVIIFCLNTLLSVWNLFVVEVSDKQAVKWFSSMIVPAICLMFCIVIRLLFI